MKVERKHHSTNSGWLRLYLQSKAFSILIKKRRNNFTLAASEANTNLQRLIDLLLN